MDSLDPLAIRLHVLQKNRRIKQDEIAGILDIRSPKTLRKYFREELDRGVTEANVKVAQALYKNAIAGDTNAQKF